MSGKNPFLGMGFGSPFITFARASSSGGGGGATGPKIAVGAIYDDDNGSNSGSIYVYDLDGTGEVKITASDGVASDQFGRSVAVGNNKVVVGTPQDDSSTGAVYVYDLDGTGEVKITASDGVASDQFGYSVAVGSNKVVVGSPYDDSEKGAVYVYDLDGSNEVKITASDGAADDQFGYSVAVGNNKVVVGAPFVEGLQFMFGMWVPVSGVGTAYIYDLDGTNEVKITASDGVQSDRFGKSVAVGNNKIVVGSYENDDDGSSSGSAYIYDLDGTNQVKINASDAAADDQFGYSVAVGNNKVVVGAPFNDDPSNSGSAYIYDLDGTGEVKITASDGAASDNFGISVAAGNNKIVVGAYGDDDNGSISGSAYIYDLDGSNEVKITASDGGVSDEFGKSVAIG